jgi:hypothetical protein
MDEPPPSSIKEVIALDLKARDAAGRLVAELAA